MMLLSMIIGYQAHASRIKLYEPPKHVSHDRIVAEATKILRLLKAPVSGMPQVRWVSPLNEFSATWKYVSLDLHPSMEPKMYLDSQVRLGRNPSVTYYGDAAYVKANTWANEAIERAVPNTALRRELTPYVRNAINRLPLPSRGGLIEIRWTIKKKHGYEFAPWGPPGVIVRFDSTTKRIRSITWQLVYELEPIRKVTLAKDAKKKAGALLTAYLQRYGNRSFQANRLSTRLVWVKDNESYIAPDGSIRWKQSRGITDAPRYRLSYLATYDKKTAFWLDASSLECVGSKLDFKDVDSK